MSSIRSARGLRAPVPLAAFVAVAALAMAPTAARAQLAAPVWGEVVTVGGVDGGIIYRLSPRLQNFDQLDAVSLPDVPPVIELQSAVPLEPIQPILRLDGASSAVLVNPEPSTVALVAAGALTLFAAARRRGRPTA